MKLITIASVVLAVLVVATGAAAAMPGSAPADAGQAGDQTNAQADEDADEESGSAGNATSEDDSENATGEDDSENATSDERRGPPADMPDQAPDFVSGIHDLVQQKLEGSLSALGEQIRSLTPGGPDEAGQGSQSGESGDPGAAPMDDVPGR